MTYVFLADDPHYMDQRRLERIREVYWVKTSYPNRTVWKFHRGKYPPSGDRTCRRPTLEDVAAARWDGRSRVHRGRFRRGQKDGRQDTNCPVYLAYVAAETYLKSLGFVVEHGRVVEGGGDAVE